MASSKFQIAAMVRSPSGWFATFVVEGNDDPRLRSLYDHLVDAIVAERDSWKIPNPMHQAEVKERRLAGEDERLQPTLSAARVVEAGSLDLIEEEKGFHCRNWQRIRESDLSITCLGS